LHLVQDKSDLVRQLAERLLDKETIAQEDIVEILGERPFDSATGYKDFVSQAFSEDADEVDRLARGPEGGDGATADSADRDEDEEEDDEDDDEDDGLSGTDEDSQPEATSAAAGDDKQKNESTANFASIPSKHDIVRWASDVSVDWEHAVADTLDDVAAQMRLQAAASSFDPTQGLGLVGAFDVNDGGRR